MSADLFEFSDLVGVQVQDGQVRTALPDRRPDCLSTSGARSLCRPLIPWGVTDERGGCSGLAEVFAAPKT